MIVYFSGAELHFGLTEGFLGRGFIYHHLHSLFLSLFVKVIDLGERHSDTISVLLIYFSSL